MEFNEKTMNRYVFCRNCKMYFESNQPSPKCPNCSEKLLTVVFSQLTGEPITGVKNNGKET